MQYNIKYNRHFTSVVSIILLIFFSCSGNLKDQEVGRFRIVVFGNTSPGSPFKGFTKKLPPVVRRIRSENPVFVVHTGNMVRGGYDWMGITVEDVERQYGIFLSEISKLRIPFYTVAGQNDLYNGSPLLYRRFLKRKDYYSFNYGNIHIIILRTYSGEMPLIDEKQLQWLKGELQRYRSSPAVLIFTHYPLFVSDRHKMIIERGNKLHSLFKRYPVKAVFSGSISRFFHLRKDKIDYYVTGCGGYGESAKQGHSNQYYIIDYDGNSFKVDGRSVSLK